MDKIIEKKTGWRVAFTKKALPWWLGGNEKAVHLCFEASIWKEWVSFS